jgi:hypothetical protein
MSKVLAVLLLLITVVTCTRSTGGPPKHSAVTLPPKLAERLSDRQRSSLSNGLGNVSDRSRTARQRFTARTALYSELKAELRSNGTLSPAERVEAVVILRDLIYSGPLYQADVGEVWR